MKSRNLRVGGVSVITILLALALLIGINSAVSKIPSSKTQIDISQNELFTISDQTRQIAANLTEDVHLYWIVVSGGENGTLELLLNKFEGLSEHIIIETVDPNVYPAFSKQYTEYEGEELANSIAVVRGDKYRFMEFLDFYTVDMENYATTGEVKYKFCGEDTLAAAIDYVNRDDLPLMYIMGGHGESEIPNIYKTTIKRDNIEIRDFSFLDTGKIPKDCDVLLICAPASDLSEKETAEIKAYLDCGGKLLLVTQPSSTGETYENLLSIPEAYGLILNPGIIIEPEPVNYAYASPYYIVPEIITHEITIPVKDNNYKVMLPITQGITDHGTAPAGVEIERLLKSSESSFSKPEGFGMQSYEKEAGDIDGSFLVGVALSDSRSGAKMVWFSSRYIAEYDTDIRVSGANQEIFVNSINWMCSSEGNIAIRNKDLGYNFLTVSNAASTALTVVFVAVIPLLYILPGIIIGLRRRRR